MGSRPSAEDLEAARGRMVPDVVPPAGGVLFCGINPGLYSAATGWHFARPGNRFWPALHRSGFTDRPLRACEQHLLPAYGIGVTNPRSPGSPASSSASGSPGEGGGQLRGRG